jgi:hypothetical protein
MWREIALSNREEGEETDSGRSVVKRRVLAVKRSRLRPEACRGQLIMACCAAVALGATNTIE